MIGKIKKVELRDIWKHEAYDFTTWLSENLDVLADTLKFNVVNPIREHGTENFNVDIVAQDEGGGLIVIENQLSKSDHDHLGKLMTYLAAVEAATAVWIVSEPRQEHIKAVTWLNESGLASFYLLKVEGVRIGDSKPAPLLTLIVGPSEEARAAGETRKQYAGRQVEIREFWAMLLERAKVKTKLHANLSPGVANWIGTSAGIPGLNYNYSINQHDGKVELYIDYLKDPDEKSSVIFDYLKERQELIEKEFGGPLEWDPIPGKRACRIARYYSSGGYLDKENWSTIADEMINGMISLSKAFKPYIGQMKNDLSL